jgi:hypothetical protein
VTQEHKNDAAKTIRNTRELIENVAKMTTLHSKARIDDNTKLQSKTKNENENQASLSCEMNMKEPSKEL